MHYALIGLAVVLMALAAATTMAWRLMVWMPGKSYRGDPAPLDAEETRVRDKLREDLQSLAGDIGERHLSGRYEQLVDAANLIERLLREDGYPPRRQQFVVDGVTVWNLDVERTGRKRPQEIIVVGAHYDTIPGSPGANDNGSAVVANLALARAFRQITTERSLRFAFFVNEESPYHMTEAMGSLRYAQACQSQGEQIVGMISLETIGCYRHEPGSQRYPIGLLKHLYPTEGDFLAVVGNVASRRWLHQIVGGLRRTEFPTEGMAAPRWLKDIFRSDHAAFWHCGFDALMITDTANFRYPHYHSAEDTVDKIHFDALTRVVTALRESLALAAGTVSRNKPD